MRKLKKMLAVLLVMIMLMSTLPMGTFSALSLFDELQLDTVVDVEVGKLGKTVSFTPDEDGFYRFYSISEYDPEITLYDSTWKQIAYGGDFGESCDFNLVVELSAGKKYYAKIELYGEIEEKLPFQIGVEETLGVTAMEITQFPYNMNVMEGFEYDTTDPTGLEIVFTLSDGSTVDWTYEEYGLVGEYEVYTYPDMNADEQPCFVIECGDLREEIIYTVVESTIESIEYSCETPIEFYEHSGGYFVDDETYEYFYTIPEDAVITIYYTDGTSEAVNFYELANIFDYHNQEEEPWTVGENYFTISYYNAETTVPVTILPSPFVNVTVNSAPSRDYVFGDYDHGYLDENGLYTLWATDLTGLSFTVEYEDGTTQTFDDDDFDIENMLIDGYEFFVKDIDMTECGVYDVVLCYKGEEITYQVDVIETDIESIEVLKAPDKAECEYGYYADFTGAVVKINYKDGTSAQATADENTMSYTYDGAVICRIKVGDDYVSIFNEEDMETGERHDYLTCKGVGLVYYGVTYTERREIASITADNVTMSGYDMVVSVEYADGSTEELTLDVICSFTILEQYTEACAMTENGVVVFSIEKWEEPTGELMGYNVYILDNEYFASDSPAPSFILGDVDGDGEVAIMDATMVQRHMAQKDTLEGDALLAADTDGDGEIAIIDATFIQRFVANIIDEF